MHASTQALTGGCTTCHPTSKSMSWYIELTVPQCTQAKNGKHILQCLDSNVHQTGGKNTFNGNLLIRREFLQKWVGWQYYISGQVVRHDASLLNAVDEIREQFYIVDLIFILHPYKSMHQQQSLQRKANVSRNCLCYVANKERILD